MSESFSHKKHAIDINDSMEQASQFQEIEKLFEEYKLQPSQDALIILTEKLFAVTTSNEFGGNIVSSLTNKQYLDSATMLLEFLAVEATTDSKFPQYKTLIDQIILEIKNTISKQNENA